MTNPTLARHPSDAIPCDVPGDGNESDITKSSIAATPEAGPRQGQQGVTARWTRRVLAGVVSVGLLSGAVGLAAGFGLGQASRNDEVASLKAQAAPAVPAVDAGEYAHGGGGSVRTGAGALVNGSLPPATTDQDKGLMVHGSRGMLVTGNGTRATQAAPAAPAAPAAAVYDDSTAREHLAQAPGGWAGWVADYEYSTVREHAAQNPAGRSRWLASYDSAWPGRT